MGRLAAYAIPLDPRCSTFCLFVEQSNVTQPLSISNSTNEGIVSFVLGSIQWVMELALLRILAVFLLFIMGACSSSEESGDFSYAEDAANTLKSEFLLSELKKTQPMAENDQFAAMFPSLKAVGVPGSNYVPTTSAGDAVQSVYNSMALYTDVPAPREEVAVYVKSRILRYDWEIKEFAPGTEGNDGVIQGINISIIQKGGPESGYAGRAFNVAINHSPTKPGHSTIFFAMVPAQLAVRTPRDLKERSDAIARQAAKDKAAGIAKTKLLEDVDRFCFSEEYQSDAYSAAEGLPLESINASNVRLYYTSPGSIGDTAEERQQKRERLPLCKKARVVFKPDSLGEHRSIQDYLADNADSCVEGSTGIIRGPQYSDTSGTIVNPKLKHFYYDCEKLEVPLASINFSHLYKIERVKNPKSNDLNLSQLTEMMESNQLNNEVTRLINLTPSGRILKAQGILPGRFDVTTLCDVVVSIVLGEKMRMLASSRTEKVAQFRKLYHQENIRCLKKFPSMNDYSIRFATANDNNVSGYRTDSLFAYDPAILLKTD